MDNPLNGVGPLASTSGVPRSKIEEASHAMSEEWKRGEDIVGAHPVERFRMWGGLLGAASAQVTLQMATEPDRWIVKLMSQTTLQLIFIDFDLVAVAGSGPDSLIVPVTASHMPRLVLPAFRRRTLVLTNGGNAVNTYYIVAAVAGPMPANFDWI